MADERNFLEGQLDPKIPAGNHDRVGRVENAAEISDGGVLLDFGHQLHSPRSQLPKLLHVFRAPDEREGDVVHAQRAGLLHILDVLLGQGRRTDFDTRQIHSLVRLEFAAVLHHSLYPSIANALDLERHQSIVQKNGGTDADVTGEVLVRGRKFSRPRVVLRSEHDLLARFQAGGLLQVSNPDARSLKIQQDGGGLPTALKNTAQLLHPPAAYLRSAVRRVDSHDVHPGVEQGGHLRRSVPGRSEGGNDFGTTEGDARHAGV
jgi:hypothetical protein